MGKRPLVICTDPGIDDFIALSMVLSKPEFDVLGMVALSGNVGLDVTVNNALLEQDGTMEDLASAIARVTKQEAADAIQALRLDTIYALEGVTA